MFLNMYIHKYRVKYGLNMYYSVTNAWALNGKIQKLQKEKNEKTRIA